MLIKRQLTSFLMFSFDQLKHVHYYSIFTQIVCTACGIALYSLEFVCLQSFTVYLLVHHHYTLGLDLPPFHPFQIRLKL